MKQFRSKNNLFLSSTTSSLAVVMVFTGINVRSGQQVNLISF